MNQVRLNILLKYLEEDPEDPFNLYAIALEYLNLEAEKSKYFFDKLLTDHPDYLPTYLQAGNYYLQLEEKTKARMIFEKGIELARTVHNDFAGKELQSALDDLLFEG